MKKDVSIVIPVKNGEEHLLEVLTAVSIQRCNFSHEIIVIDSGSKDSSLDIVRKFNVRLIQIPSSEFNHGATRNLGVQSCESPFIVFLTQDATPADSLWLQALVDPFLQDERIAGVFGKHLPRPGCDPIVAMDLQTFFDRQISPVRKCWKRDAGYEANKALYVFFSNNNSCIRRSVWEKIPFRSVEMSEDQFWAQDILEAGHVKCYEPSAVVYHSHSYRPVEWMRRNFDEFRAYRKIGTVQKLGIGHGVKTFVRSSLRDMKRLWTSPGLGAGQRLYWSFQRVFNNMGIATGQCLGARYDSLPSFLTGRSLSGQTRTKEQ